jgi:DNA polymerase III subunit alpha
MTTQLDKLKVISSSRVAEALRHGPTSRLRMAGIVIRKQERTSQKGNRFAFVQISDSDGVFEVMIFSELLAQSRELLEAGTPVLLSVDADRKSEEEIRFLAQTIEPLTHAVQKMTQKLYIHVVSGEANTVGSIQGILGKSGAGKVKVSLLVQAGKREAEIELPGSWNITESMPKALRSLAGVGEVREA